MRKLNRKQYKIDIKEFRKVCPIARITNKWVLFKDEYNNQCLMYVKSSLIKRAKPTKLGDEKYKCFKFKNYLFKIILYGTPCLYREYNSLRIYSRFEYCPGFTVTQNSVGTINVVPDSDEFKADHFRIISKEELNDVYDKMIDVWKSVNRYKIWKV